MPALFASANILEHTKVGRSCVIVTIHAVFRVHCKFIAKWTMKKSAMNQQPILVSFLNENTFKAGGKSKKCAFNYKCTSGK